VGDPALASPAPGKAVLATRGADDSGWTNTLSTTGNGWTAAGWGPLGGVLSSSPAVAAAGGRTDVVILGLDGAWWRQTQTSVGGAWSGWRR
jgi:hypothetical protein